MVFERINLSPLRKTNLQICSYLNLKNHLLKFQIAYYLVLLYLTVILNSLIPFISDAWSHEFNVIEHISSVHVKYGVNHLHKELSDTNSGNEQSKNQSVVKFDNQVSLHIFQTVDNSSFAHNKSLVRYQIFKIIKPPFVFISSQGPPPKFS